MFNIAKYTKGFTYVIRGTVTVEECIDDYETILDGYDSVEYVKDIKKLIEDYSEGIDLAEYIWEETIIYGLVDSIKVDVEVVKENGRDKLYSRTEVITSVLLSDLQKMALLDYITGQFSDGFGEGLEQQVFNERAEVETYDGEGGDDYEDVEVYISCYFNLWQYDGFKLYYI